MRAFFNEHEKRIMITFKMLFDSYGGKAETEEKKVKSNE
jgi:hypothetical protein